MHVAWYCEFGAHELAVFEGYLGGDVQGVEQAGFEFDLLGELGEVGQLYWDGRLVFGLCAHCGYLVQDLLQGLLVDDA